MDCIKYTLKPVGGYSDIVEENKKLIVNNDSVSLILFWSIPPYVIACSLLP